MVRGFKKWVFLVLLFVVACSTPNKTAPSASELARDSARLTTLQRQPNFVTSFTVLKGEDAGAPVVESTHPLVAPLSSQQSLQKLRLTSMCDGLWRVRNTNNVPIDYTWDVYRNSEAGSGIAAALTDTFFSTSTGSQTVRLFVDGRQQQVKASNPNPCAQQQTGKVFIDTLLPDGTPVSADVTLTFSDSGESFTGQTDSTGALTLEDLPLDGLFTLDVDTLDGLTGSASGYLTDSALTVALSVVVSEPIDTYISGRVLLTDGTSVADAMVTLSFIETSFSASTVSDADGEFEFSDLPTDGTFTAIAYVPATGQAGSTISFLEQIYDWSYYQDVEIILDDANTAITSLVNSDFADGTFQGWQTEGDVNIANYDSIFTEVTSQQLPLEPRPQYTAVVSTAPDDRATGRLFQPFFVDSCHTHLEGKIRFLSDEWPEYFGTQYNDAYLVRLTTPSGVRVLAQGNLNSSSWIEDGGSTGYFGAARVTDISIDVSDFAGTTQPLSSQVALLKSLLKSL